MQLSIPDLDLRHIYESGQCFRWEPLGQDTYRIPAFGRTLTVRQTDGVFDFSCGAGEFDALWRSYFDLDTDYAAIKARVAPRDAYLQAAVAYGWGMRILRQDLWEVTMSYPEAHTALRAVKGVGPKVADCICLFGLHHVDAFPVDTHVKQILSAHYPKGFPFRRYAGCAGILQQYMFYYDLHGSAQAAP